MTVHARIQRGLHILRKSVGRQCNDGDFFCIRAFRLHGADGFCCLQSVHFRHHNVHQDNIIGTRRVICKQVDNLLPVRRTGYDHLRIL